MLMFLLVIGGLLWALYRLKMAKTLLFAGLFLYSFVILCLGTLLGCFLQMFINQEPMRHWELAKPFVTMIVDSAWFGSNFWIVFFLPIIGIVDILHWIFQVSFAQPTFGTFVGTLAGLIGAFRVWNIGITTHNQVRDAWVEVLRSPAVVAEQRKKESDDYLRKIGVL